MGLGCRRNHRRSRRRQRVPVLLWARLRVLRLQPSHRSIAPGFFVLALGPARAFRRVARIFQRGDKIFLALAFEFLLRRPEACDPCGDFIAFAREIFFLSWCRHPVLILAESDCCRGSIGNRECGANAVIAAAGCLAVDKLRKILVGCAASH